MVSTTYLITGANRGIGHGLLSTFLARPNTICIAAVRDPSTSTAVLSSLSTGAGSKLIVVKIDSCIITDAKDAVKELQDIHKIEKIDVVIANAGIGTHLGRLADLKVEHLQEHINVNVIGPLTLFQTVLPLLTASPSPKFCLLGSTVGSIGGMENYPFPMAAYGMSKAMAHYLVRKIHLEYGGENGKVVSWAVYPGFVQTDTGNAGARFCGYPQAPDTIDDAARFVVKSIDEATMEKTAGHFPSAYGGEIEW
jgi:norsolorinic acid ketoreductase